MIGTGQHDGHLETAGVAAQPRPDVRSERIEPERRRPAFRVSSVLAAAVALVVFGVGLAEIALMWLSDATLLSAFDELARSDLDYRSEFNHFGIVAWAIVPPLLVQLWRPAQRVAPMLQALAVAGAGVVVMAISGALEIVDIVVLAVVGLLAWLHPCATELFRRPGVDGLQARSAGRRCSCCAATSALAAAGTGIATSSESWPAPVSRVRSFSVTR